MKLPEDPNILLSLINMKLRDGEYDSLEDLCSELNCEEDKIIESLHKIGYEYNADIKQFR